MTKNKLVLFVAVIFVVSLSSCGIFGKGCGCPTFGKIKQHSSPGVITAGTKQSLNKQII